MFSFKNFKKILRHPLYLIKYLHIVRLYSFPRYTKGYTYILKKKLCFVDSASFVSTYKEIFERELYKFKTNTKAPYIIDCGANIGLSVLYFKKKFPEANIIAFEPDETIFSVLKENIFLFFNEVNDIKLVNCALWNHDNGLVFFAEGADGGRAAHKEDFKNVVNVKTVRLGTFLDKKVDFLKIDIEGAELTVLRDVKDLLFNVENIFVEYHSFVSEEQNLDELLSILTFAGFRYYIEGVDIINSPFVDRHIHAQMDLQLNIYGTREISKIFYDE